MESTKNEIKKAVIKNDRCNVEFEESTAADLNKCKKECGAIIHNDLLAALSKLKTHLVVLTEQPEADNVTKSNIDEFDLSLLANYTITGYSLSGSDEDAGATIIGQKLLKSGSVLNLTSPLTKYTDDYDYAEQLGIDIESCNYEVKEYVFNNKFGVKQETFDFDKPEEANIEISNDGLDSFQMTISNKRSKKQSKVPEAV